MRPGALLLVALGPLAGRPSAAPAQQLVEFGARTTVATAAPVMVVAGPEAALRLGRRDRVVAGLGLGVEDGGLAGRGELLWHFLMSPEALGRPGVYAGAGLGVAAGERWRGLVVATLGVDWSPGGRSGWMAELGVGGGLRLGLGYRWRRGGSRK